MTERLVRQVALTAFIVLFLLSVHMGMTADQRSLCERSDAVACPE